MHYVTVSTAHTPQVAINTKQQLWEIYMLALNTTCGRQRHKSSPRAPICLKHTPLCLDGEGERKQSGFVRRESRRGLPPLQAARVQRTSRWYNMSTPQIIFLRSFYTLDLLDFFQTIQTVSVCAPVQTSRQKHRTCARSAVRQHSHH